jgi:hypothetical protein
MVVSASRGKQEYRPPKLQVYGDLTQLTLSKSNMGNSDGGSGQNHKTQ